MIIGIISDTHGLLRESVISHLENCDLIIHAGDNVIDSKYIYKMALAAADATKRISSYL